MHFLGLHTHLAIRCISDAVPLLNRDGVLYHLDLRCPSTRSTSNGPFVSHLSSINRHSDYVDWIPAITDKCQVRFWLEVCYFLLIKTVRLFADVVRFAICVSLKRNGLSLYSLHATTSIASRSPLFDFDSRQIRWGVISLICFSLFTLETSA